MSLDIFFDQFAELADAPNGVKKLRELILQLAVQGKLVPQDPSDEPASVLVERIRAEKVQLIAEGKLKREKQVPPIAEDEMLFDLPSGWEWVRLDKVCLQITDGVHSTPTYTTSGTPFLSVNNLKDNQIDFEGCKYITAQEHDELTKRCKPERDDILLGKVGSIGVCAVVDSECEFSIFVQLALLKPLHSFVDSYFLRYAILSKTIRDQIASGSAGSALQYIGIGKIQLLIAPLPPLAEQRRIVAKVDQLMVLCDELETRQNERRQMLIKLNDSALNHLLAAQNAEDFAAHWQRLHANFDLLYDTPETIGRLRQGILQLAVQGKLVPQDPNDESALVLLDKIRAEKARLIAEGKLKKAKPLPPINEDEQPFELPIGWEWVRLDMISDVGTGSTPLTTNRDYYINGDIPWITSAATAQNYITVAETYVTQAAVADFRLRIYKPHTLIVALYGQGKTRGQISELRIAASVNQAIAAISLFEPSDEHRLYVKYYFKKQYDELRSLAAGGAQPNLNVGKIKESLIPLPPLAEQHRIVAKVDQLMALCDELEAKLKNAQAVSEQLMEAVVRQVLAGGATTYS